jgi:uncharacterized RDD family membrane protein YckC
VPRKGHARSAVSAVDALVARMMASDPNDRFASYDELLRALELASAAHTRPGGFWVRIAANLVDFLLVMTAMGAAGLVLGLNGDITLPEAIAPVALFQLVATAWRGTTPGKTMFELQVIDVASGRKPRWTALLVRTVVLYGSMGVFAGLAYVIASPHWLGQALEVIAVMLPFAALARAALRSHGKRPPWDHLAGTMVRYKTTRART